jgi:hypothetical protein
LTSVVFFGRLGRYRGVHPGGHPGDSPGVLLELLDLRFFVGDVLARNGIKFLDLHLFRHRALVFGGRIKVTGSRGRLELDFFTHGFSTS